MVVGRLQFLRSAFIAAAYKNVLMEIFGQGKHEKVLLLLASANRDESRWERPDELDITRRVAGHIGFGTGIHGCVGQMVARLEGEAVLSALATRVASIEIVGEAVYRDSSGLRALSSLPVRVARK